MQHNLTELQARLLPMLEWFHDFCTAHGLRYYLLGGTMLGAARHQGFIPWDDDIDVGMPRRDYMQFLSLTSGKAFGNYIIESIDSENVDYFYGFTKIYDTQSTLIENTRYHIRRGIFLDLFPLDGLGDSRREAHRIFTKIHRRRQFLLTRTCGIRKGRKWYKNLAIYAARMLPRSAQADKKLMRAIDAMCSERDYDSCSIVCNLYGNWGERETMERAVFGTPVLYHFEQLSVYGAEDYDAYLTSLYGDWRKLPPKEKQVTHHDFESCDLKQAYLIP